MSETMRDPVLGAPDGRRMIDGLGGGRIDIDADNVEDGLGRLVVAILELVRQVIEAQALRRAEGGSLRPDEVERLGRALGALNQRMAQLCDRFGSHHADGGNLDLISALSSPDGRSTEMDKVGRN
jgi:hypothetical protein